MEVMFLFKVILLFQILAQEEVPDEHAYFEKNYIGQTQYYGGKYRSNALSYFGG
jgi:hypothetical protein